MRISGRELLLSALSEIIGPVDEQNGTEIAEAARLSGLHLDGIDQTLLSGSATGYDVTLPVGKGRFTWGLTGSDITAETPGGNTPDGGVISWSYVEGGVENTRGALASVFDYQNYAQKETPGSPPELLWQDRSVSGSQAVFFVLPVPSEEVLLRLYARVPALREIRDTAVYDLPDGVASYVALSLATGLASHFGVRPANMLTSKLRDAERIVVQLSRTRFRPRLPREYVRIGSHPYRRFTT